MATLQGLDTITRIIYRMS